MNKNRTPDEPTISFSEKIDLVTKTVAPFDFPTPRIFASKKSGYRMRAEFRIWHQGKDLYYVMFESDKPGKPFPISTFPIASNTIQKNNA